MLNDLKIDLETHCKHPDTPFFHRIKFDSTSIYLTKTNFDDLLTSKNDHGYYRVFSWDDLRAKNFLRVELNEASPDIGGCTSLGSATLIGRYRPEGSDLQDVQYETNLGKAFFKSAYDEIEGRVSNIEHIKEDKIDSSSFMKMNEIIPTGAQGKAIYGQGNYIIDGPAGTGKSTTVLQKIKILQKQNNLNSSQICVLVKNKGVINNFSQLLDSLSVKTLKIKTIDDFLTDMLQFDIVGCTKGMSVIRNRSSDIYEDFRNGTNFIERISRSSDKDFSSKEYPIEKLFKVDYKLYKQYIEYKNKCDEIKKLQIRHSIKIKEKENSLSKECEQEFQKLIQDHFRAKLKQRIESTFEKFSELFKTLSEQEKEELLDGVAIIRIEKEYSFSMESEQESQKIIQDLLRTKLEQKKRDEESKNSGYKKLLKLFKTEEITLSKQDEELLNKIAIEITLSKKDKEKLLDEIAIKNHENKKNDIKKKKKVIDPLVSKYQESKSAKINEINLILDDIKNNFFSEKFTKQISSSLEETRLLSLYLNKLAGNENNLETIIIDEAQDVSLSNIELIHLFAKNMILTGDELQKEEGSGLGGWGNLSNLTELFSINGTLNIYKLKHNFRQTYELGNCSYNYRQLALHRDTIDIKGEYFDNQKGFNKPKLSFIKDDSDFKSIVESKIELIKDKFTDSFPVIVFYENNNSLERMKVVLEKSNISFSVEYETKRKREVEFVSINNIAGREFTVVIAPLANNTPQNIIYIMLSRAKYDLTLITGINRKIDRHIRKLIELNIIL